MVVINGKTCSDCGFLGFVNGVSYCRIAANEVGNPNYVNLFCFRNINLGDRLDYEIRQQMKMEDLNK